MTAMKNPNRIIMLNDCSDANARSRIESQVARLFPGVETVFYKAEPFATLSLSFLLSEAEFGEGDLVLFNAAPRNSDQTFADNRGGVMVFAVLKSGAILVGPNEGNSLTLLKNEVSELFLKRGDDGNKTGTQFRSAYVFPKAAAEFVATPLEKRNGQYEAMDLNEWPWRPLKDERILWIDSFDNIKLSSTQALEANREYTVRIIREGKLVGELRVPYREKLTKLAPGELGLITGSSLKEQGMELARRTGQVGLAGARRFIEEEHGFSAQVEDVVQIT